LEAASGKHLFFVVRHLQETYVLDLEGCRVPGGPCPYHIKGDYKITDSMTPLGKFELLFTDDAVRTVYAFQVEGSGPLAATGAMAATGAGGVFLRPVKAMVITTPASCRQKKGEEAEDSCEDLGFAQLEVSDIDEGDAAVDTDAESSEESGNTTGSASDSSTGSEAALKKAPPKKVPATGGSAPATGGKPDKPVQFGKSGPTISDNGYFYIKGHELDLKMYIHDRWLAAPPLGIGRSPQMSKTITPATVGETRADPVRSLLVLKAWMLCRARIHPGWIESNGARQRLFTEEADLVLAQVKRLQPQADGLLGNAFASEMMRLFVPDIVANI
jgi:hypothetical protein